MIAYFSNSNHRLMRLQRHNLLLALGPAALMLLLLPAIFTKRAHAQNQTYLQADFNNGIKPAQWELDSAGTSVQAGTCQDGSRVFSFTCSDYPASSAGGVPPGFAGNVAVIDLDNVGGAASTADSLYCLVTDTVNTTGATNLELSFDWEHESFVNTGTFRVEVWDSTSWQQVFSQGADGSGSNTIDITTYSNSDLRVRFCFSTGGSTSANIWGSAIDNVLIQNISCPAPTNLTTTGLGKDSVSLRWNSGSNNPLNYIVRIQGPGGDTVTTTDTNTTIKGLQANTSYKAQVQEVCNTTDTSFNTSITFKTPCNPFSARLYQGFDSATAQAPIPVNQFCWDTAGNASSQIELVTGTANNDTDPPVTRPNKVTFNDADLSAGDTALLISPALSDLTAYNNRLRMQVAFEDTADSRLFIGVMDNTLSSASLTVVDTLTARSGQAAGTWQEFITDLDNSSLISSSASHVAIANGDGTWESSIDNIRYEQIPTCKKPEGLTVSNLYSDSAELTWSSRNSGNQWLINYDSATFRSGSGDNTVSVNDTTATLNNLNSGTRYQAYVQEVCQSGDTSYFSAPITFSTFCSPFTTPYRQQFDGQPEADPFGSRRFCWSTRGGESDQIELVAFDNNNDTDTPPSRPNKVTFNDADLASGDTALLISPEFPDLPSYDNRIQVQVAFEDTADSRLFAGVMDSLNDPATFRVIDTFTARTNQAAGAFQQFILNLTDTTIIDSQRYVAFANGDNTWETSIDNAVYDTIGPCRLPDQLTVKTFTDTSARLAWRSNGTGSTWVIEYDTAGFTPGQGTVKGGVTDTFTTLNGLTPNTKYEAYVREICLSGDTSSYGQPLVFRTACDTPAPVTLPYTQGFEGLSGSYLSYKQFCSAGSAKWKFQSTDTAGRLRFSGSGVVSASGNQAATLDKASGTGRAANDWILTLNMSRYDTAEPYVLYFDHRDYQDAADANDSVWVRGNQGAPWIGIYDLARASSGSYQSVGPLRVSAALSQNNQAYSPSFQVRFGQEGRNAVNGSPADGRSFDNIRLTQQDLTLSSFPQPAQVCGLSAQEPVSVALTNTGLDTIAAGNSLQLTYQLDTNTYPAQSVTLNQPVAPGDSVTVQLNQAFDLSAGDTAYRLQASVQWQPDLKADNDTATRTITVPDPNLRADNILDTSARIKWTNTATASSSQLIWGTKGFDPAQQGNKATTGNTAFTIGGLQKATSYDVYLREVCSSGDTGLLRGPVTFTTRDAANDLSAVQLIEPTSGCGLTANEPVSLQLVNFGFDTIPANTNLSIAYQKNAQPLVQENVTLSQALAPSDTVVRTFTQPVDLSQQGQTYRLQAWADWATDQSPGNDTTSRSLYASNVPAQPTVTGDSACAGGQLTLQALAAGKQIDWYADSGSTTPILRNSGSLSLSATKDTTLYVRAYNNPDSCLSPYKAVEAVVQPIPQVSFTTSPACASAPVSLDGQASINQGALQDLEWDLGDGRTRQGRTVQPSYSSSGNYTVTFTATSDQGCSNDTQRSLTIKPAPEADFASDTACGSDGTFTFEEQADRNGLSITGFQWSLGNGETPDGPLASTSYNTAGTYTVTLAVQAGNNCSDTLTKPAYVLPEPSAAFTATGRCQGEAVPFTNQSSVNGATLAYRWNFDDGQTSTRAEPDHVYELFGERRPELVAFYDSLNQTCADTAQEVLTIDRRVEAGFSIDKENGGTVVLIPDNAAAETYQWDLGNGDTAEQTSPEYTYASAGTYTITLETITEEGCRNVDSQQVTIESVGLPGRADQPELAVYPNPAKGGQQLTVEYSLPQQKAVTLQLQHISGKLLYQRTYRQQGSGIHSHQVPLPAEANSGVYVLQLQAGDKQYQKRLILMPR